MYFVYYCGGSRWRCDEERHSPWQWRGAIYIAILSDPGIKERKITIYWQQGNILGERFFFTKKETSRLHWHDMSAPFKRFKWDLKRCCGLPLEVVHRGLFRHLNWSKNWRNPPETTQALRPRVSEEDTTGYKALMLPLSKGKIVTSDANAHIWDIWHWHKEQNSPNPQRAGAFCSKRFVPREFIWVGYSLDQVKSITLSSPAHEASSLAVQHRGKILSEIYSNIISSTMISLVEIISRAFWNSYWMAVEKHGQYFSRGWQSMKVFLIPRIPQDLVLPLFSGIWPLTLYLHHPEKQISLWSSFIFNISWPTKTSQH